MHRLTDDVSENHEGMRDVRRYFRENPQVFILVMICLILGLGTFLIVLFGIASSGPGHVTGEPEGAIAVGHVTRSWPGGGDLAANLAALW